MVFVISVLLVVVAFVTLVLGVVGVGDGALRFVYVSIASCLLAALFLAQAGEHWRVRAGPPADVVRSEPLAAAVRCRVHDGLAGRGR